MEATALSPLDIYSTTQEDKASWESKERAYSAQPFSHFTCWGVLWCRVVSAALEALEFICSTANSAVVAMYVVCTVHSLGTVTVARPGRLNGWLKVKYGGT